MEQDKGIGRDGKIARDMGKQRDMKEIEMGRQKEGRERRRERKRGRQPSNSESEAPSAVTESQGDMKDTDRGKHSRGRGRQREKRTGTDQWGKASPGWNLTKKMLDAEVKKNQAMDTHTYSQGKRCSLPLKAPVRHSRVCGVLTTTKSSGKPLSEVMFADVSASWERGVLLTV